MSGHSEVRGGPIIRSGALAHVGGRKQVADDLVWDDRAEQDANQLVGLLFVAATPLRRTEAAETLRISQGRLARACAVLQADPPRGLRLQSSSDGVMPLVVRTACSARVTVHRRTGREPTSGPGLTI